LKCPRCQHDNPQGARFCEECAAPLARICSNCGTTLSATAKFCHACAHPVAAGAGTPSRTPDSYTPKHLAERIINSKAALEGERKQVTVLFADLKGSMELLADGDPEEARKILDPVLELMMEAVHRYEGTVNQVMGDGIMALFGAPVAHEDHAVRACYAALRMQEAVHRYSEELRRAQGVEVQIRVGLNSGEVVVRSIGSDLRMDYTAVGQTTHLAGRMEQLAAPGTIRLTADTVRLAEGYVEVRPLGPVPVKGLGEPVEVFELTGAGAARTRLEAAARHGLTHFVGRNAELEQLCGALDRARLGHGQVVAVVGEPGVGKSRLYREFTRSHHTHGWLVLESGSVSYGKATPYLPVIDFLRSYFRLEPRDDARQIREKVTGKLLILDEALRPAQAAILALLDVPVNDPQWQAFDPPERRQRTVDALKRLVLRESQIQPLVLLFEDLHWVDSESQAVLDALVDSLPAARVLFLVNFRPEYRHGWGSKTYYAQLRVDPLPPESADQLLGGLLGMDASLDALKPLLVQRTEGNPLFLEESVRALVENGVLLGERGAYRLTKGLDVIQIPPTVQAVLAARIDRLLVEDKHLLQSAAVIGKDVPFSLLEAIANLPEPALRAGLARLQAAEFLYEAALFPEPEYTFKHALTHEVTYASLLGGRRRDLHARIVDAIERLHPGRLAEHMETLAHHAFRGERWEVAVTYCQEAGARAFARSANRDAASRIEQALDALGRLPETPRTQEQGIDLRFAFRNAITQTGSGFRGTLLQRLREAEALAMALGDRRRLGRALDYMSNYHRNTGELDEAVALADRALRIGLELEDLGLEIAARFHLANAYYELGEHRQAAEQLMQTLARLGGDLAQERFGLAVPAAVLCRVSLAWSLAEQGAFADAVGRADEARRLAEAAGRRLDLVYALRAGALTYLWKGDVNQARAWSEQLVDISGAEDLAVGHPTGLAALGYAEALSGDLRRARSLVEAALTALTLRNQRSLCSLFGGWLGEILVLEGHTTEAQKQGELALALARRHRQRGNEASALRLLGEVAARRVPLESAEAEAAFRHASAMGAELRMKPLVAHCHLGLGKLYRRTDRREQAQEHLATATTMYRDMGMTYWLEKAEAEFQRR
jgi:class 3 adenylate cyclase/tetratricopeptide (TPR) repeat protein